MAARPDRGDAGCFARTVIVQGAGAIGALFAVLFKLSFGADVTAIGAPLSRMEQLKLIGVERCVLLDPTTLALTSEQRRSILADTPWSIGADIVVDASGSSTAFAEAMELVRPGGTVIEFGAYTPRGDAAIAPSVVCQKDLQIFGSHGYGPRQFGVALNLLADHNLRPAFEQISRAHYRLSELGAALKAASTQEVMKVVVSGP